MASNMVKEQLKFLIIIKGFGLKIAQIYRPIYQIFASIVHEELKKLLQGVNEIDVPLPFECKDGLGNTYLPIS